MLLYNNFKMAHFIGDLHQYQIFSFLIKKGSFETFSKQIFASIFCPKIYVRCEFCRNKLCGFDTRSGNGHVDIQPILIPTVLNSRYPKRIFPMKT